MKTFESFLQEKHFGMNPMLLDDELTDAFDNWMGQLEQAELIAFADEFGKERFNAGIKELN